MLTCTCTRAHATTPVMSASERAEMVYECIRGGAEEYLIKPVTRKEVQNIWTHVIRRLNSQAQLLPCQPQQLQAQQQGERDGSTPPAPVSPACHICSCCP